MDDESDDNQSVADEDYYAFLNVSRTVSSGLWCGNGGIWYSYILTSFSGNIRTKL